MFSLFRQRVHNLWKVPYVGSQKMVLFGKTGTGFGVAWYTTHAITGTGFEGAWYMDHAFIFVILITYLCGWLHFLAFRQARITDTAIRERIGITR